jgi:hypothetical protein
LPSGAPRRWYLRPCAFGLVGLALAVVLWGLGYKLSLYHRHPDPATRTPVAKLWLAPRPAGLAPAARSQAHRIPAACALVARGISPPLDGFAVLPFGLAAPGLSSSGISLPSRSPPQPLRLA